MGTNVGNVSSTFPWWIGFVVYSCFRTLVRAVVLLVLAHLRGRCAVSDSVASGYSNRRNQAIRMSVDAELTRRSAILVGRFNVSLRDALMRGDAGVVIAGAYFICTTVWQKQLHQALRNHRSDKRQCACPEGVASGGANRVQDSRLYPVRGSIPAQLNPRRL